MDTCKEFLQHVFAIVILTKLFSPFLSTPSSFPLLPPVSLLFFRKCGNWNFYIYIYIYVYIYIHVYTCIYKNSNLFRMMGNINNQINMEKRSKGVKEIVIATDPTRHLCPLPRQNPEASG